VRVRIGDVWIDQITFADAVNTILDRAQSGLGGYALTPNIDHIVMADSDSAFRAAYAGASLSLVDGTPLLWAARALGVPLPEKVSGSDLMHPLVQGCAERGLSIYLCGAGPGVAERVAAKLCAQHPTLKVVGCDSPMIPAADAPSSIAACAKVKAANPALLFVAFGSPKQEVWIHHMASELGPTVAIGVGAAFDFIDGTQARAPKWMSRAGLEWVFRLSKDPKRMWRRYLVRDPKFIPIFLRTARMHRAQRVQE